MSNFMRKNFYLCFSKIKCLPPMTDLEHDDDRHSISSSPASTPTSVHLHAPSSMATTNSDEPFFSSSSDDSDLPATDDSPPPDLATVYASRRFFFSSPGLSNSIVESSSSTEDPETATTLLSTGGVAVRKYSPDPLADFRRSMQEMVEAREPSDPKEDWEYLHELLLCYLRLNPKHTHNLIIGAFTDLIISLMFQSTLDIDDTSGKLGTVRKRGGLNL